MTCTVLKDEGKKCKGDLSKLQSDTKVTLAGRHRHAYIYIYIYVYVYIYIYIYIYVYIYIYIHANMIFLEFIILILLALYCADAKKESDARRSVVFFSNFFSIFYL